MIKPADRLSNFSEYYFSAKLRQIRQLMAQGRPIINLGIGSPDQAPAPQVTDTLKQTADLASVHGYQPYQGIPELQEAVRSFYKYQYSVPADHLTVLPLLGSKEGITHISLAYLNPGDQVLVPGLSYPTYTAVTRMVGAEPIQYPLVAADGYAPDWEYLERVDTSSVKLMWINYPHMPTGAKGNVDLFERLVEYAQHKGILLCHDNPYSFIGNDNPLSVFCVTGADEVAIELNSLSKTFNMAGWRIGWAIGHEKLIQPVLQIKSNMDSGMFRPVQEAAVTALHLDKSWFESINKLYTDRRKVAWRIFDRLKCTYDQDQAGMFVWARVPSGSGEAFSDHLLEKYDVFITPGFIFGKEAGDGYVRLSLCASVAVLEEVYNRLG